MLKITINIKRRFAYAFTVFLIITSSLSCGLWSDGSTNKVLRVEPANRSRENSIKKTRESKLICKDLVALSNPPSLSSLDELEARFLAGHNDIRRRHNLADLVWDKSLARYAQSWAQYLKDNYRCQMKHRSKVNMMEGKRYGENLAINWGNILPVAPAQFVRSPEWAVQAWSAECEFYDYENNHCAANKMCGHYTQVVWKSSERVGCGVVICSGAENFDNAPRAELWVCNYDPPGNWVGQWPY